MRYGIIGLVIGYLSVWAVLHRSGSEIEGRPYLETSAAIGQIGPTLAGATVLSRDTLIPERAHAIWLVAVEDCLGCLSAASSWSNAIHLVFGSELTPALVLVNSDRARAERLVPMLSFRGPVLQLDSRDSDARWLNGSPQALVIVSDQGRVESYPIPHPTVCQFGTDDPGLTTS